MKNTKNEREGKGFAAHAGQHDVVIWATANLDDRISPYRVDAKQRKRAGSQRMANPWGPRLAEATNVRMVEGLQYSVTVLGVDLHYETLTRHHRLRLLVIFVIIIVGTRRAS